MTTFQQLRQQLPTEIARLKKISDRLQGRLNLISIYEKHFDEKFEQGDNLEYEIARVNILRTLKGSARLA